MRRLRTILALALLPLGLPAADLNAGFEAANKFYEEGKYGEAASAYEKLAQSGQVSEPLYFNLGNAWFKAGKMGRAIAAYRQAEALSPRDPDVRANLQFARNQVSPPTLAPTRWQRWLGRLTLNEWTVLAAVAVWVWFLMLALLLLRPALKPALRGYVYSFAALVLLLCACTFAALRQQRLVRTAIVAVPEAAARLTPLPEAGAAFTLHDGAELRVLDQKDDWLQVNAGPQRTAWIQRKDLLLP